MTDVETMVVGVLTGAEAQKLKAFTFMGKHFAPGTFGNIKNMIEAGFIKVIHEPKKGKVAEYDYGTNTMYVGFESAETLPQKALVAHEAVHAVYDMVKMKMSVADSESIAYIVQCTYARANAVDQNDRLRVKSDSSRDKVFEVAWGIAGKLLNGQQPSWDDCVAMRDAVSEHPFYSAKFAKDAGFNG